MTKDEILRLQSFNTEGEYRASPSLNYSLLKEIPNGPKCLAEDSAKDLSGSAITVGGYVDSFFTNREHLGELYYTETSKPKLTESIDLLFQVFAAEGNYEPTLDECVKKCREYKIYSSITKDDKLKKRIPEDLFNRLSMEKAARGKTILTQEQLFQSTCAIENILSFQPAVKLINGEEDEIVIYQFKYEFVLKMNDGKYRSFKVMYDIIRFNLTKKTISASDIKTGTIPTHEFGGQIFKYRYDIQGILYFFGLLSLHKRYFPEWNQPMPGDFQFIYSRKIPNCLPIIVRLSERFMNSCAENFEYKGERCQGLWRIMEDAHWYLENKEFSQHRIIAENSNIISINQLL
jgi:hypothetical protein